MQELRGSVFAGMDGCEHQEFDQPVQIIHGTGLDVGTVIIQIGDCHTIFNSTSALMAALNQHNNGKAFIPITG